MLTISPQGVPLSPDQASRLDAEFFRFSPLKYFVPRIEQMLRSSSAEVVDQDDESLQAFRDRLGLPAAELSPLKFDVSDRKRQLAVDAVSVRHHAAETLMRLLYGLVVAVPREGDAASVWVAITDSPISLRDVTKAVAERLNSDGSPSFAELFLPAGQEVTQNLQAALEVAVGWTNHAIGLLTRNDLAVNTGYNKVKHGLSVSARDDVRVEFVQGPIPSDGTIPLSSFESSVPLFDRPFLTFLYRPPRRLHLETASIRVDLETTLAEAWMIAVVAGAVFAVAAQQRFPDSDDVADFPRLPTGPTPDQLLGGSVRGMRSPVTEPTVDDRPPGIFFHGSFQPMEVDFGDVTSAVVVDQ